MNERLFGTDGIRGRAGEGWLRPEPVSALGRVIGEVTRERSGLAGGDGVAPRALLGHDGRRSGPELEHALARGLRAAGLDPSSAGLITTPGLALLGRMRRFAVTAMVSASHNPADDNGIKVFDEAGEKLADEAELEIERRVRADPAPVAEGAPPEVDPSLAESYVEHLVSSAPRLDGLRIVVDCANGGASRVAPSVLERLGAEVVAFASEPDGANINAGCGATATAELQARVPAERAALGVALDGDGDRCMLVDEKGALVDGDAILAIMGRHAAGRSALPGGRVVATVMSNRGLHRALREVGVEVVTVGVGDRRVVEALRSGGLGLGGEQSGHVVFGADNHHIGDGLYTALRVLAVVRESASPLSALASIFRAFPQVLVNVPVGRKPELETLPDVLRAVRSIESELGENGRVLLRYSGTEPLARVMVEGPDEGWIRERAESLARMIAREIGG